MKDLISREAALNCFHSWADKYGDVHTPDDTPEYQAIEGLPSVQPEQRWIPCSERLPEEDGGLYLVTDYAKSINRRRMHLSRCYMNKEGFWSDVPIGYKVVAWMPLPEPYKEEEEHEAD